MTDGQRPGSVEVAERGKSKVWLWALLGAVLLGLVVWLAVAVLAGDDEDALEVGAQGAVEEPAVVEDPIDPADAPIGGAAEDATEDVPEPLDEPTAATGAGDATAAAQGDGTATGQGDATTGAAAGSAGTGGASVGLSELIALIDRLPVGQLVDRTVDAQSVLVQEVVADEAFYVGPEPGQTVLVRLPEFAGAGAPESPFVVTEGDRVSFTGTLAEIGEDFIAELRLYDPADALEPGNVYLQARDLEIVG